MPCFTGIDKKSKKENSQEGKDKIKKKRKRLRTLFRPFPLLKSRTGFDYVYILICTMGFYSTVTHKIHFVCCAKHKSLCFYKSVCVFTFFE